MPWWRSRAALMQPRWKPPSASFRPACGTSAAGAARSSAPPRPAAWVVAGAGGDSPSALLANDWPGNVRELEHLVGRAVLRAQAAAGGGRRILSLDAGALASLLNKREA